MVAAPNAPAGEPNSEATWTALAQPVFHQKAARIDHLVIERDGIQLMLESGSLEFSDAVNGIVTAAVFRGAGRLRVQAANAAERQQIQLFLGTDRIDLAFSEAVLSFSNNIYNELSAQLHETEPGLGIEDLYASRTQHLEELGASFLPRLFKSVLSDDHTTNGIFRADLKTAEMGWVEAESDGADSEEVVAGRWQKMGPDLEHFDVWTSFPAGDFGAPVGTPDFVIRSYNVDARVTSHAELFAIARVTLDMRRTGERVGLFRLNSNLRVEKILSADGRPLVFIQAQEKKDRAQSYGDYIAVVLPEALESRRAVDAQLSVRGPRGRAKARLQQLFCSRQRVVSEPSRTKRKDGGRAFRFRSSFPVAAKVCFGGDRTKN